MSCREIDSEVALLALNHLITKWNSHVKLNVLLLLGIALQCFLKSVEKQARMPETLGELLIRRWARSTPHFLSLLFSSTDIITAKFILRCS